MYLHIGNGNSVKRKNIIGIFDLDTATVSKITKDFINKRQKEGAVTYLDSDLPRAFLLLDEDGETKVRLSRLSSSGLKIRLESGITEEKVIWEIEKLIGRGTPVNERKYFTPRGKRILEISLEIAVNLNHQYIGTEHLLLAILS